MKNKSIKMKMSDVLNMEYFFEKVNQDVEEDAQRKYNTLCNNAAMEERSNSEELKYKLFTINDYLIAGGKENKNILDYELVGMTEGDFYNAQSLKTKIEKGENYPNSEGGGGIEIQKVTIKYPHSQKIIYSITSIEGNEESNYLFASKGQAKKKYNQSKAIWKF